MLTVYVYNPMITLLGVLEVSELTWEERCYEAGVFELWCDLSESNKELAKVNNIVWIGKESAGIIEFIELLTNSKGTSIHIKGRLAESYLYYRVVYPRMYTSGKVSAVIQKLVYDTIISPEDSDRAISTIELSQNNPSIGPSIKYQQTGGIIHDEIANLCSSYNVGMRMKFFPKQQKFSFQLYEGVDRTINQIVNPPILFSTELDYILESEYSKNISELCTNAYIAGEDSGVNRKYASVGTNSGYLRRELFVDARDIQSEVDEGEQLTDEEYMELLRIRGYTKLEDYRQAEVFSAQVRTKGDSAYSFGTDFSLGDKVTIYDSSIGVQADVIVTAANFMYSSRGEELVLTFGTEQLTLSDKLRRRTN